MRFVFLTIFFTITVLQCCGKELSHSFRTHCLQAFDSLYFKHVGQCFTLNLAKTNRKTAVKQCKNGQDQLRNGRLAIVGTDLLSDLLVFANSQNVSHGAWVGLTQQNNSIEPAGGWEWVDSRNGEAYDAHSVNWKPGEPNNFNHSNIFEDHAYLRVKYGNAINDEMDSSFERICEYAIEDNIEKQWKAHIAKDFTYDITKDNMKPLITLETLNNISLENCTVLSSHYPTSRWLAYKADANNGTCLIVANSNDTVPEQGWTWFTKIY